MLQRRELSWSCGCEPSLPWTVQRIHYAFFMRPRPGLRLRPGLRPGEPVSFPGKPPGICYSTPAPGGCG